MILFVLIPNQFFYRCWNPIIIKYHFQFDCIISLLFAIETQKMCIRMSTVIFFITWFCHFLSFFPVFWSWFDSVVYIKLVPSLRNIVIGHINAMYCIVTYIMSPISLSWKSISFIFLCVSRLTQRKQTFSLLHTFSNNRQTKT